MEVEPERLSDDGYGTDNRSPTISPTKEQSEKLNLKTINRDSKEFRTKYFTEKVLNNSANGVIYQGIEYFMWQLLRLLGYRISDEYPVVIKQVPRSKIHKMMAIKDRPIPAEFYYHLHASDSEGVVKVLDWYERRTSFVLVMEKPPNSIDLFEFSRNFGAIKEEPAKIIIKQVQSVTPLDEFEVIKHQKLSKLSGCQTLPWFDQKVDPSPRPQRWKYSGQYFKLIGQNYRLWLCMHLSRFRLYKCCRNPRVLSSWDVLKKGIPSRVSKCMVNWYLGLHSSHWWRTIWHRSWYNVGCPQKGMISCFELGPNKLQYDETHLTQECRSLIDGCLKLEPNDRLKLPDILDAKWFS